MKTQSNKFGIVLTLALVSFLSSCKKESVAPVQPNQDPSKVTLLSGDGLADGYNINWTAATDPDGDNVVYDLYVMQPHKAKVLIGENLTSPTFHYVVSKAPAIVVVITKDGKGGESTTAGYFSYTL
jgi:hypothetical protein